MPKVEIDKIYTVGKYIFKNYILLGKEEIINIWNWRNDEKIRKWMFHSDVIPFKNHLKFIQSLKKRNDCFYWMVYVDDIAIGAIYLQDVNGNTADFGYYVKPGLKGSGFMLVKEGLNFVFNYLGFASVGLSVACNNLVAFALDVYVGFEIDCIKNIILNGKTNTYIFCKQYSLEDYMLHEKLSKEEYLLYMHKLCEIGYFYNANIDISLYQKIKEITN